MTVLIDSRFCSVLKFLSVLLFILWGLFAICKNTGLSIQIILWDYGLVFMLVGICLIAILRKYLDDIFIDLQNVVRKEVLRPFVVSDKDVDKVVDNQKDIYIEGPDRHSFYVLEGVDNKGFTIESVITGEKIDYKGDIRKEIRSLITDGFHVYLRQAYDEMVSCGFTIDIPKEK